MTINAFTQLLQNPQTVTSKQTSDLEVVLSEFPYFQSARFLFLRGLYQQKSFRYNLELKKCAVHTLDRDILFQNIVLHTETEQKQLQTEVSQTSEEPDPTLFVKELPTKVIEFSDVLEITLTDFIKKETSPTVVPETTLDTFVENSLPIASEPEVLQTPLQFTKQETHSFAEWLQLTKVKPIERNIENTTQQNDQKKRKTEIIDRFIETNPKIIPQKDKLNLKINIEKSFQEPTHLMTETLAQVYLQQNNFSKAINAYEILILKYPEKSIFFANQIEEIKKIQQNNNCK